MNIRSGKADSHIRVASDDTHLTQDYRLVISDPVRMDMSPLSFQYQK